jgi:hypothetical protein
MPEYKGPRRVQERVEERTVKLVDVPLFLESQRRRGMLP